jgi:hypothetical protein
MVSKRKARDTNEAVMQGAAAPMQTSSTTARLAAVAMPSRAVAIAAAMRPTMTNEKKRRAEGKEAAPTRRADSFSTEKDSEDEEDSEDKLEDDSEDDSEEDSEEDAEDDSEEESDKKPQAAETDNRAGRGSHSVLRGDYHGGRGAVREYTGGMGPPQVQPHPARRKAPSNDITLQTCDEKSDWINDRYRKRVARASNFDQKPVPKQLGARVPSLEPAAIAAAAADGAAFYTDTPAQQTRVARGLVVGNLPPRITQHQIRQAFEKAIQLCGIDLTEDPTRRVRFSHDLHSCFLEFKTPEMCSACMMLDGLVVMPGQPSVIVKRPTRYDSALAPPETNKIVLDVSKLEIINRTVLQGPHKIFIGGWHHCSTESQVLKLLQTFGKVKAFHLVKNTRETALNRGICFVEYVDPARTPLAIAGLNGRKIGKGKPLTAKLAEEPGGGTVTPSVPTAAPP